MATHYIMNYLVREFSGLADLKEFAPAQQPLHPVEKSEVVPMKVLFKDEKYRSETSDILSQLMGDADLKGASQVRNQKDMERCAWFILITACTLRSQITINILTRIVCVCLSVTDVTHFRNVYSGNEATTYRIAGKFGGH